MLRGSQIKRLADGRAMLNVGCGLRMHFDWNNVDFSPYARLAHHQTLARVLRAAGLISSERYQRLLKVDSGIVLWNLRKGIPFPDGTFDVVYHSHLLEHIPKNEAGSFLQECRRVLKQGGILRVVVPDLAALVLKYTSAIAKLKAGDKSGEDAYDGALYDLFDQMVRTEPASVITQRPLVRFVERLFHGSPAKAGELHHWMYDEFSLRRLLETAGFRDCRKERYDTSLVAGWNDFYLDVNNDGSPYKRDSLYMEAAKWH